jgi:hypothetical protein
LNSEKEEIPLRKSGKDLYIYLGRIASVIVFEKQNLMEQ